MCGFSGYFAKRSCGDAQSIIQGMNAAIRHRGPDDSDFWHDREQGIVLGHQRLAIIDLSPAAKQPMISASNRFVIVFNGEIYNHQELRQQLALDSWRGHSDTETLLAGFDAWGIETTLRKCVGMFALALWDRQGKTLTLARDRLGEKPLYYGWQNGVFLFGSELKALRAHPGFVGEINRDAIALQLRHNYILDPYSIYRGIFKLPPGTWLVIDIGSSNESLKQPSVFWSLRETAELGQRQLFTGSDQEAIAALDDQLRASVALQMVADVPLGAFLSGGIDSSTVVALMQAQSNRSVRTFSIGFNEFAYNEAEYAKTVARHLGTEHTELYVTPQQALDVIPRLPSLYDEPFSDSSQIPTYLVSQMTRQHVTVGLSGDGGDELFGGYNRHISVGPLWRRLNKFPLSLRQGGGSVLSVLPTNVWDRLYGCVAPMLPARLRVAQPGTKVHKLANILGATSGEDIYRRLVSHWGKPCEVVIGAVAIPTTLTSQAAWPSVAELEHRMMALDTVSYLPGDILTKVDRAAMGVSLETRVPFLDHRVVELAWRLPLHMKIRNGEGKWILRQVLYKYVPKELIERPKMGFGVPIDSWLRGPLRDWAESLLEESRLRQEGYFNPAPIRKKWAEHLSRQRNWQYHLWDVLMFQAWLEQQRKA
ncbi:asparagine synthase (glutamine-hydrolyzing) [uncultured Thiobacillus sp.]|uniref:asparagine synthase (glutamine-hydrolyzing) n=1 Tax=uncultured Thiobacillus sp. TaxID=189996 RepID=UPI00086E2891|nr:asparagine synthase (glutamine-hydrolyzing) [uncultured Thiobacillus sp.]ODU31814.1 MAG: asparagine synthase (glutamine-hydrolyzing) [Thiobacillus sp. SCN 62-729]